MPIPAFATGPGYIKGRSHTFEHEEPLPEQVVNLLQDDLSLLSGALTTTIAQLFMPAVFTTDHKMPCIAGADQVTVEDNVLFMVGGVLFNTRDLNSRVFQVPDYATRFLRASVAPECGELAAYETQPGVIADPLDRQLKVTLAMVNGDETDPPGTGGGATTRTNMRLLKAVKGGPGSIPAITLYANAPSEAAQSGGASGILPAGLIVASANPVEPCALRCNGGVYSRTTYSALFERLGTIEGDILPADGVSAISVDSSSDRVTIDRALPVGSVIRLSSTGSLPGGLQPGTDYHVREQSGASFKVSETPNGLIVDLTNNGSGTLTVLSWSFRTPVLGGYFLRGVDDGAGVDLGAETRQARGDGQTGDKPLTVQMDNLKSHNHPLDIGLQGVAEGSAWAFGDREAGQWGNPTPTPMSTTVCQATGGVENLVRNKSVYYHITHGLAF